MEKQKLSETPTTYYLNEDANGCIYVSKRPMSQMYYATPALLRCVSTKRKNITKHGVFISAICVTINDEILRIVDIKNRKGWQRDYSRKNKQGIATKK